MLYLAEYQGIWLGAQAVITADTTEEARDILRQYLGEARNKEADNVSITLIATRKIPTLLDPRTANPCPLIEINNGDY
jgi:hypothetical protein